MQRPSARRGSSVKRNPSQKGLLHRQEAPCRESQCREASFTERRPLVEKDAALRGGPFRRGPNRVTLRTERMSFVEISYRGYRQREKALNRGGPMQRCLLLIKEALVEVAILYRENVLCRRGPRHRSFRGTP